MEKFVGFKSTNGEQPRSPTEAAMRNGWKLFQKVRITQNAYNNNMRTLENNTIGDRSSVYDVHAAKMAGSLRNICEHDPTRLCDLYLYVLIFYCFIFFLMFEKIVAYSLIICRVMAYVHFELKATHFFTYLLTYLLTYFTIMHTSKRL